MCISNQDQSQLLEPFRALEKLDAFSRPIKLWLLLKYGHCRSFPIIIANNCVQTMVRHLATFRAFPADLGQLIQCINIAGCEQFIRNGVVSCQFMWWMFRQPWMSLLNIFVISLNSNLNTYKYIVLYLHQYSWHAS